MTQTFQPEPSTIRWKMHFASPPERVYEALATDAGRAAFWAESAPEVDGAITFHFMTYESVTGRILDRDPPKRFKVEYFGTIVEFSLTGDGAGGTDLLLYSTNVDDSIRAEMTAGWVSVLMAMKAAVDHGIDLRNHDALRSWQSGYADN